jgi:hypothetical protein
MTVRSATATFAIATVAAILTAGPAAAQPPGTSAAPSPAPLLGTSPDLPPANAVKGFSIVLVEGSLQPGSSLDLPAPARAAIEDIKDFLPFKSYQLLDASWMLGATDVKSRLRGGDRDYDVAVTVTSDVKNLNIKFVLRDASGAQEVAEAGQALARQLQERANQQYAVQRELGALELLRQRLDQKHPDVQRAEQSVARARERLRWLEQSQVNSFRLGTSDQPRRVTRTDTPLIDTSFSMRVGETVVVGTSRVNGERALIALMTAVSKEPVVVRRQF